MERYIHKQYQRENPSFSSTLLDAIYRSMIEGDGHEEDEEEKVVFHRETMRKTQSKHHRASVKDPAAGSNDVMVEDMATFRRACMVEKWIEKKVTEEVILQRKSAAAADDFQRRKRGNISDSLFVKSNSSSSDSSWEGGFSSSEAESLYGVSSRSSNYTKHRPKPISTSVSVLQPEKFYKHDQKDNYDGSHHHHHVSECMPKQKTKHDLGFLKTKSKALKIYGDLKKIKQPISPGVRLASFLNSLFTTARSKKAKISSTTTTHEDKVPAVRKSKSTHESTYSSVSSFTRSCLSTTPSSRRKSNNGTKMSVRFYPVSVVVGEDYRPCGHKSLYEDDDRNIGNSINEELRIQIMEKNRRVEEVARDLLNKYRHKVDVIKNAYKYNNDREFEEDEEEDDDSCVSSDLFELDHLNVAGIDRYSEELPVYETTHLDTKSAHC